MTGLVARARSLARRAEAIAARIGPPPDERDVERAALALWRNPDTRNLAGHSHAPTPDGINEDVFARIGDDAWQRFDRAARQLTFGNRPNVRTVLDYGCGYGAQAAAFAAHADQIIGVDVQRRALDAAQRAVQCAFRPVLINQPEDVRAQVYASSVDAFVSFYVFELLPNRAYGERVLRVAYGLMRPAAIGFVQFKYPTDRWHARALRRGYNTRTAPSATRYRPDEFWAMLERVGFEPGNITIERRNELDHDYAYASFVKPVR